MYFEELDYAVDTHTAVGLKVSGDFKEEFGEDQKVVCLSTASPYKFPTDVLSAIKGKVIADPFKASKTLSELTAMPIPSSLTSLTTAEVRFKTVCEREDILQEVIKFIQK